MSVNGFYKRVKVDGTTIGGKFIFRPSQEFFIEELAVTSENGNSILSRRAYLVRKDGSEHPHPEKQLGNIEKMSAIGFGVGVYVRAKLEEDEKKQGPIERARNSISDFFLDCIP